MADVTFTVTGDKVVLTAVGGTTLVQTGTSEWTLHGDVPPALPTGAIGIWPFDQLAGGSIPNLIDGTSNLVTAGAVTSGAFTGHGTITFPSTVSFTNFTVSALVKLTSINTDNQLLYDANTLDSFTLQTVSTFGFTQGAPANWHANAPIQIGQNGTAQTQFGGLTNLVGKGWHVLTWRRDATSYSFWIDDVKLYQTVGNDLPTTFSFNHLTFGISPEPIESGHQYAGALAMWTRGLSDAEVRQAAVVQRARGAASGIVTNEQQDRIFVNDGDSNHGPMFNTNWPWLYAAHDSPEVFGASYAIGGSVVANLVSRGPLLDSIIPPDTLGRKFILAVGIGTNDIGGFNSSTVVSTYIPSVRAYMMARKAAGWTLAMFTLQRRGDLSGATLTNFETVRAIYNADILANPTLYGLSGSSAVIDIGSIAGIGSSFDSANYWTDLLHLNAAGSALVEAAARPVLNAL